MYFNKVYIDNSEFKPVIKRTPSLTSKLFSLGLDRLKQKELLHFINHTNRPTKYPIEDVWNGNEYDELNSINIMSFSGEKVSKVLGLNHDFKGQKSIKMIQRIIEAIATEDDIVLDFFAGTGSTGCAVLQQNILDNSNRRFILVLSVCLFKDYLLLLLILFTVFIPLLISPVFYYFLSFESVNLKLLLSLLKVED